MRLEISNSFIHPELLWTLCWLLHEGNGWPRWGGFSPVRVRTLWNFKCPGVMTKMLVILLQKPPCWIHGNVIEFWATYHIHAQIFHQGVKIKERGKHWCLASEGGGLTDKSDGCFSSRRDRGLVSLRMFRAESQHFYPYGYRWIRVVSKERSHKWVEHDRPGELSPE